jgi:hypothetical protein
VLYAEKSLCRAYYGGDTVNDSYGPGGGWSDAAIPCFDVPRRDQCHPVLPYRAGSAHPVAMNAVCADGHVSPVAYTVGREVFARSCSRR